MKYIAKTDFGKVRQVNQDYFIAENRKVGIFPNIFIVADGAGSNRESGFASKHCSDFVLDEIVISNNEKEYISTLDRAYKNANTDLVYRIMANPSFKGMGTTMVTVSVHNSYAICANVGDSRLYHIRDDIKQVTRDHSLAEELVRMNEITRDSEKYKEMKNQLSRALGASKILKPDYFQIELEKGDYLLLCSDGLSNMVPDEKILEIVKTDDNLETKADNLINAANVNGGKDNICVILIEIDNIDYRDLALDKEELLKNKEVIDKLMNEGRIEKKESIKEVFERRTLGVNAEFRSRSRRKKEDADDEK